MYAWKKARRKIEKGMPLSATKQSESFLNPLITQDHKKISGVRWAVIIGISNYRDSRIPSLRYAAADAKAFYAWAISPDGGRYAPANIKLLLDEDATVGNIRDALYIWLKQALAEDVVTIYFACHGSPESPDSQKNLYLLPYDTDYQRIASTGFPNFLHREPRRALARRTC